MYRRSHSSRLIVTVSIAAVLSLTSLGCQQGLDVAEVTGQVTMDGAPMQGVAVEFQPVKGSPSYGTTDDNGNYELLFKPGLQGALLGPHKVRITGGDVENEYGETVTVDVNIPKRYNKETTLEYTVVKGKNESVDWELTSR
jgi:hypothetical protein